jgi:glycosyltransferase involved in cell wall biosynthesis
MKTARADRPLRIALVYDAVYPWIKGGGEKHLYELALELRDRGHEVHLFAMHCWDGPPDVVRDGLFYHALCPRLPLYNARGRRSLIEPLRFAWGVLTRLPRYRLERFDIVDLIAFPYFSVLAFWLVRTLSAANVPWLLTWLEVWGKTYWRSYLGPAGLVGAGIERLCARLAPNHLCISPTTAERLHRLLGVPRRRIDVIPRGLPPIEAPPSVAHGDTHHAVCAGRLLDYKRVDLVIRAWPEVVRRLPDAVLHVVGDGPERPTLERLAHERGLDAAVRFHGQLARPEEVLQQIAAADLLLQPSAREGQSAVVLEAALLGVPVLAADGPETAVGDFLGRDEEARPALLSVSAGADAWAGRIVELFEAPALRQRLAERGRTRARELDWRTAIAPRVEALYRRLASQRSEVRSQRSEGGRLFSDL